MTTQNSCYTYFSIVGSFDPDELSALLKITPEKSHRIGDPRRDGMPYDFACWEIGRCDEYDPIVANQMRKTISVLQGKTDVLCRIREEYDVRFFLSVVPSVSTDGVHPCLSPSLDVIDFCHATRTEIDIDLYVYEAEKE